MPLIEKSSTGRARCCKCSLMIAKGELRIPLADRGYKGYINTKYCHLACYRIPPPISCGSFVGYTDLSAEDQQLLQEYVDKINIAFTPKKRRAEDSVDDRVTKKIKLAAASDALVWTAVHESSPIHALPPEMINLIFQHLTPVSAMTVSQVCKKWLLCSDSEDLWQRYCENKWPEFPKSSDCDTWKQHFRQMWKNCCIECRELTNERSFFHPVNARVCLVCRVTDKYKLIKKTDLKDRFRLTEDDLKSNGLRPQFITCNGTRAHFYLRSQVEKVAAMKQQAKENAKKGKK